MDFLDLEIILICCNTCLSEIRRWALLVVGLSGLWGREDAVNDARFVHWLAGWHLFSDGWWFELLFVRYASYDACRPVYCSPNGLDHDPSRPVALCSSSDSSFVCRKLDIHRTFLTLLPKSVDHFRNQVTHSLGTDDLSNASKSCDFPILFQRTYAWAAATILSYMWPPFWPGMLANAGKRFGTWIASPISNSVAQQCIIDCLQRESRGTLYNYYKHINFKIEIRKGNSTFIDIVWE